MQEVNIKELIDSISFEILRSEYSEKDNVISELNNSYREYNEMLFMDDDFSFSKYDTENLERSKYLEKNQKFQKYINQNPKYFSFLITIYELFILPLEYASEINNILINDSSIQEIVFEDSITTIANKPAPIQIEEFEKLGKLLFPDIFILNDFNSSNKS